MATWSALPKSILIVVMKKLINLSDKIRFSSVCSSWRSVALQERFHLLRCAPPGFIIPGSPNNSCKARCFLPFTKIKLCNAGDTLVHNNLPLLSLPDKSQCCGSYQGWLVMVNPNLDMAMVDLVSGVRFRLPGVTTLPPVPQALALSKTHVFYSMSSVNKAFISSSPTCSVPSKCFFFVTYTRHHALAYCKLGDTTWSPLKSTDSVGKPFNGFTDAIYHKGQLYALHETEKIFTCELTAPSPEMTEFLASPHRFINKQCSKEVCYLVESGGELLLVYRRKDNTRTRIGYRTRMFEVYRLDFSLKKWIPVVSLGEYALFLGRSQSFSLSELKVGGIKRNHIYFMDDCIHADHYYKKDTGYDMGEFNLESSTIDFYPTSFRLPYQPGFWVTPALQSSLTLGYKSFDLYLSRNFDSS
ncbi:hypothetical protein POUND7_004881 [Theobroma cacao]